MSNHDGRAKQRDLRTAEHQTYLGDGAYAYSSSSEVWIVASNGETVSDAVCLDGAAIDALITWLNELKELTPCLYAFVDGFLCVEGLR